MVTCLYVSIVFIVLIGATVIVEGGLWASPALEELDELNDIEIYRAIWTSMNEWQRKHKSKKHEHDRKKREEPSVCYPDLGCFESSGPFEYLDMLPSTPEEISTKFLMYPSHNSRKRSSTPHLEIPFGNFTAAFEWAKQGFNASLPTKVIIHGFGSHCSHIWVYEMRSALLANEETNIICVDWANGAELPNYVKAAANTRLVGKQLSMLLKGLIDNVGLKETAMHLIGFSLGAHVAGFAGYELGNLSRITGLDPAGPLFELQDPRARLDQNDAKFVDVIHSNGENLILGGLGSWQPMGHVDFYPNGGRVQKGCTNLFVGAVSDIIWSSAIEGRSLCNHRRAYKFFTDSVSPKCLFPAFPCSSYEDFLAGKCFPCSKERNCGNMGYYADKAEGRGQLYLITRDEDPFCAHQYLIKIETTKTPVPIINYGRIQITLVGESSINETFVMTKKDDEEMVAGEPLSRIIVPHPILLEFVKIEILYVAYSGWLSSGLSQWKIDRIVLSDSVGTSLSVCKKGLTLDSGVPVVLPLFSGECNDPISKDSDKYETMKDRAFDVKENEESQKPKFVPTPVIRIGNEAVKSVSRKVTFRDAMEIFNLPFLDNPQRDNHLDTERETSRALNTRVIRLPVATVNSTGENQVTETVREVVEPILKPHSNKIGRSHDIGKEKAEIMEPILGPTTSKTVTTREPEKSFIQKITNSGQKKELVYDFYEEESTTFRQRQNDEKWKRHDSPPQEQKKQETNGLNIISMTVQILPQRLARMFEQAEKYARETLFPLISTNAPKIIRNFISPVESTTKYVPLIRPEKDEYHSVKSEREAKQEVYKDYSRNSLTTRFFPALKSTDIVVNTPASVSSTSISSSTNPTTTMTTTTTFTTKTTSTKSTTTTTPTTESTTTTPYSHIQKIFRKGQGSGFKQGYLRELPANEWDKKTIPPIFIDLPVYEEKPGVKYIPLVYNEDGNIEKGL